MFATGMWLVAVGSAALAAYHVALLALGARGRGRGGGALGAPSDDLVILTPIRDEPPDVVESYLLGIEESSRRARSRAPRILLVADYSDEVLYRAVSEVVERHRERGLAVELARRERPVGGRNGAINFGMASCGCERAMLLDVDSVPMPEALEGARACDLVCVSAWRAAHGAGRSAEAIGFMVDYGSWLLYDLRSRAGLFVYPLGSGTTLTRKVMDAIGPYRTDVIQDDMWLGTQLAKRGVMPQVVGEVRVSTPSTVSSFMIQQARWAYGTTDVLLRFGGDLLRSPLPPLVRLEALFYLAQPILVAAIGLGWLLVLLSPLFPFGLGSALPQLAIFAVAMGAEGLCVGKFAKGRRLGRHAIFLSGRSSAISLLVSVWIVPYVLAALVGFRIPYRITPKGSAEIGGTPPQAVALLALSLLALALSAIRGALLPALMAFGALAASAYVLARLR
ncbi:MAG: glycosyltransferase family 2 protein [Desulfurococcaceae archaeon]